MKASILNASAGSGKTYRLAYKYVRDVVEEPSLFRHILAVTFTNKATEEMKRRILQQIHSLASGEKSPYIGDLIRDLKLSEGQIRHRAYEVQSNILHNYSHFTVLTIDKFFQRLLRAFIQELGVDIGYNLEIESSTIIEQSVDALIELSRTDETLHRWLLEYIEERVEDGRRWDVREGILSISGELFKEEARRSLQTPLSKEELKGLVAEQQRKARELKQELQTLGEKIMQSIADAGLEPASFKGGVRSVAQVFRKLAEGALPTLTDTQRGSIVSEQAWYGAKSSQAVRGITPQLQRMMALVEERLAEAHLTINTASLMRENYRSFALLSDLNRVTEQICHEQNTMLLNQTSRFVEEFVKESDAPFIYEKVGNRFSRFMIDEFQDTSRREWNNFLPLLRSAISQSKPTEESILIVGDIKQSIYRWRGGDWRILCSDAVEQLGRRQTEIVNMVDNYRSLSEVVNFNNEIIDRVVQGVNETLNEELSQAVSSGVIDTSVGQELDDLLKVAYEGHRQNPKRGVAGQGYVEVVTYEQTPPVIERVCEAIDRGFKPCDIMILTRTNREAASVAQMLLAFKRQQSSDRYRFDVMTQQALVVGYAPVSQFIIAVMRLVVNSEDILQRALYNKFLQLDVDTPLSDDDLLFMREVRMFAPIEVFEMILKRYNLGAQKSDVAYVQAIHEQVIDFCCNRIGDIVLFLKWWEQSGASKSLNVESSERAIEILTLHKAKGLEKRVVIIPFCKWSMTPITGGVQRSYVWAKSAITPQLPIAYKSDMSVSAFAADYYRERVYSSIDSVNMLYVALTRAAESLHVMIPVTTSKKSGERGSVGVGREILRALPQLPQSVRVVEQPQQLSSDESERLMNVSYQFGELSSPVESQQSQLNPPYIMDCYDSHKAELRLRMPSKRYREDGEYKPREVGIMMHKAFESATTTEDVYHNVEVMLKNSQISACEHEELNRVIHDSFKNPLAQEWFTTQWDSVRSECDIIRPQTVGASRPDRVMIKGERCVVVDYKFGALHSKSYERQMRGYVSLMQQMGYTQVEGYLWYLRQGEISRVE